MKALACQSPKKSRSCLLQTSLPSWMTPCLGPQQKRKPGTSTWASFWQLFPPFSSVPALSLRPRRPRNKGRGWWLWLPKGMDVVGGHDPHDRRRVRQLRGLCICKCYIGGTTWSFECSIKVIHPLSLSRKKKPVSFAKFGLSTGLRKRNVRPIFFSSLGLPMMLQIQNYQNFRSSQGMYLFNISLQ